MCEVVVVVVDAAVADDVVDAAADVAVVEVAVVDDR